MIKSKAEFKLGPLSYKPVTNGIERIEKALAEVVTRSKENKREIDTLLANDETMKKDIRTLRLESFKTQILLNETSDERKLYLFDEYKKLGGNGWMNEWMEDYKVKRKNNQNKERG
jgi:hypothetical protein